LPMSGVNHRIAVERLMNEVIMINSFGHHDHDGHGQGSRDDNSWWPSVMD
jgi:hypothetical protein